MIILKNVMGDIHEWCFVSGKINALESYMFNCEYFEKLLDFKTTDGLLKYIANSKLKGYFTSKENLYNFEKSIDAYFFDSINEISLLSPIATICDLFLLKYKFLDFKNFLKKRLTKIPHESIPFYIFEISDMERLWEEKIPNAKYKEPISAIEYIPSNDSYESSSSELEVNGTQALLNGVDKLKDILRENKELSTNNTLWIIDLIMDNAYLCYLKNISIHISAQYIKEYLGKFIFLNVIESLMRAKITECNIELLKKYFLVGYLDKTRFLNLIDLDITECKKILIKELPVEIVNNIITDKVKEDKRFINLTKCKQLFDNYLLDVIRPVKNVTFGPERIFGYLCGLDGEMYNLKLIIGGKVNKLESQLLKDRLRNCYV